MLRRLKKEVEKSLPPKEETILFTGKPQQSTGTFFRRFPSSNSYKHCCITQVSVGAPAKLTCAENTFALKKPVRHAWRPCSNGSSTLGQGNTCMYSEDNAHHASSLWAPAKFFPPVTVMLGMSEVQRKVYKGVLMRDIDTVNGTNAGRTAILNIVMQLRKCCNHPYLFPNTEDRNLDPMGEHLVENCGKVKKGVLLM